MQIIGIILAIIFIGVTLFKGSDSSCNCNNSDENEEDCDPWMDPTCPDYWIYGPGADEDRN